jgi:hypothetical protein
MELHIDPLEVVVADALLKRVENIAEVTRREHAE